MKNIESKIKEIATHIRENIVCIGKKENQQLWFTGNDSITEGGISFFVVLENISTVLEVKFDKVLKDAFTKLSPTKDLDFDTKKRIISTITDEYWKEIVESKEKRGFVWGGVIPDLLISNENTAIFKVDVASEFKYEWDARYYWINLNKKEKYNDFFVINALEFMKLWFMDDASAFSKSLIPLVNGNIDLMGRPTLVINQKDTPPIKVYWMELLVQNADLVKKYTDAISDDIPDK